MQCRYVLFIVLNTIQNVNLSLYSLHYHVSFFCGIILSAPHSLEKVSQCEKTVLEPLKSKHKDFDSNNNNDNNNALREISRVFLLKYL